MGADRYKVPMDPAEDKRGFKADVKVYDTRGVGEILSFTTTASTTEALAEKVNTIMATLNSEV